MRTPLDYSAGSCFPSDLGPVPLGPPQFAPGDEVQVYARGAWVRGRVDYYNAAEGDYCVQRENRTFTTFHPAAALRPTTTTTRCGVDAPTHNM